MATPPIPRELLQQAVDSLKQHGGNQCHAADALGMSRSTFMNRIRVAHRAGVLAGMPAPEKPEPAIAAPLHLTRDVEMESLRKQLREAQAGESLQKWAKAIILAADERAQEAAPAPWLMEHQSTPSAAGIPTLMLSDLHWGEVVRPEEIGGVNQYDLATAQKRLKTIVEKACVLLRDHVVGDYSGIVLALGGDMVSGSIHDELEQTNEGTVAVQTIDLFEHLQAAIIALADEFGRVHIPAVTGNHGRMNKRWQAKQRAHLSFEWLLYQFLQRAFKDDERISFQIAEGPDTTYDLLGTGYCLTHGDTFKGGDGIIGPIGPVTRGALKRGRMASAMGVPFDVMLLGHWHTLTWGSNFIINGTTKGFDEYAMSLSITPEPPSQALWLTNENHGRTIQLPVYA